MSDKIHYLHSNKGGSVISFMAIVAILGLIFGPVFTGFAVSALIGSNFGIATSVFLFFVPILIVVTEKQTREGFQIFVLMVWTAVCIWGTAAFFIPMLQFIVGMLLSIMFGMVWLLSVYVLKSV